MTAYFTSHGESFQPTAAAGGHWGAGLISGPAVAGIGAYALERDFGRPGFLSARFTIDLIKPAKQVPTTVETRVVWEGPAGPLHRMRCAAGRFAGGPGQHGPVPAVRGPLRTGVDLVRGLPSARRGRLFVGSDDAGWSVLGAEHQNTSRKRAYYRGLDVVDGIPATPFVRAAVVAEAATNMVLNMGTGGIGYIWESWEPLARSAHGR